MKKYPEPVVGAYIIDPINQKILLCKSPKWNNLWIIPGGHIDWGESYKDTVKREVKEEIGVEVENVSLIKTFEGIFPKEFYKKAHFIYLQCQCFIKKNETIKLDQREIYEAQWFSMKKMLTLSNLHPITEKTLHLLKQKKTNDKT